VSEYKSEVSRLVPIARVRQRYGDVSDMWVNRRVWETRAALKTLGLSEQPADDERLFPLPVYIGRRRFWDQARLDRYDRARPKSLAA